MSVIIPLYNGEKFIEACLKSVFAQTHQPLEVLVVDDGSEDQGPAVARSFEGVRLISQPNRGVAAARNAGVRAATGELLAFQDQDDTWSPEKLSAQVAHLSKNPELDFTLALQHMVVEPGLAAPGWLREGSLESAQIGFLPGTLVIWKRAFDQVGLFAEQYRFGGDDVDWFARARDAGLRHEVVRQVLLTRRIHDGNLSRHVASAHKELLAAIREKVNRRRTADGGADGNR